MQQQVLQGATGARLAQHGDDRVVAGHGACDARQGGFVDPACHEVGGPRRGPDHRHRLDQLDRQHQLPHQGYRAAVALARADQPELLYISRDRRLGGSHVGAREGLRGVLLGMVRAAVDEIEDRCVAPRLGRRHVPLAFRIVEWARSIWALSMISGGTSRTVWSSTALTMTPASRHACWTALARGSSNSNACINPSPRTSLAPRSSRDSCMTSPISAAWPTRPSRSITESTAIAAAHASGFPPNVEPWSPGSNTSARGLARHAPIGTPPPSPLASVITSGVMPWCWCANQRPVRPSPVCTSSRMRRRFWASHHARTPAR